MRSGQVVNETIKKAHTEGPDSDLDDIVVLAMGAILVAPGVIVSCLPGAAGCGSALAGTVGAGVETFGQVQSGENLNAPAVFIAGGTSYTIGRIGGASSAFAKSQGAGTAGAYSLSATSQMVFGGFVAMAGGGAMAVMKGDDIGRGIGQAYIRNLVESAVP